MIRKLKKKYSRGQQSSLQIQKVFFKPFKPETIAHNGFEKNRMITPRRDEIWVGKIGSTRIQKKQPSATLVPNLNFLQAFLQIYIASYFWDMNCGPLCSKASINMLLCIFRHWRAYYNKNLRRE